MTSKEQSGTGKWLRSYPHMQGGLDITAKENSDLLDLKAEEGLFSVCS